MKGKEETGRERKRMEEKGRERTRKEKKGGRGGGEEKERERKRKASSQTGRDEGLSDYEKLRLSNIARNQAMLETLGLGNGSGSGSGSGSGTKCEVCGDAGNAVVMLLCGDGDGLGCNKGFHIFCLRPAMKRESIPGSCTTIMKCAPCQVIEPFTSRNNSSIILYYKKNAD